MSHDLDAIRERIESSVGELCHSGEWGPVVEAIKAARASVAETALLGKPEDLAHWRGFAAGLDTVIAALSKWEQADDEQPESEGFASGDALPPGFGFGGDSPMPE